MPKPKFALRIEVDVDLWELIERARKEAGESRSAFVRSAAEARAREYVTEDE